MAYLWVWIRRVEGMILYPEPYQSMYQQRRLGSMGFEWRSSSVRYAVGTDIKECHFEGEQGSLSSNSSASIESDFMTSSGRRVKRMNLDGKESSLRDTLSGKSRFGKKPFMKNSSRSKVLRPRRVVGRNALSFLSRISGKALDGEKDVLEGNSSQSYSSEQETEARSEETEVSSKNEENRHLKGKAIVSEDLGSHKDNGVRFS
nr:hypothetical protein [Tanacetum cinerariifolium]